MHILRWIDDNLEKVLMIVFLIVMVLVMGFQIIMRYIFNSSLTWSEELTRYLFVWSTFLSISFCLKYDISIEIDQLFNLFPKNIQKIIDIAINIIMLCLFIILFQNAIGLVGNTVKSAQTSPAMGLPMYIVQVSTVAGFCLCILRVAQNIRKILAISEE